MTNLSTRAQQAKPDSLVHRLRNPHGHSQIVMRLEAAERIEALEAELATCRAAMAVMDNTVAALEYENGSLKAIVQGWHWLAVGPDEMGDYYTQKQLIKASEPYASPALKEIGGD